jgi:hypothetical protein
MVPVEILQCSFQQGGRRTTRYALPETGCNREETRRAYQRENGDIEECGEKVGNRRTVVSKGKIKIADTTSELLLSTLLTEQIEQFIWGIC